MVREILTHLLEAEPDDNFKEVYHPAEELSLEEIRAATPGFFSAHNTRLYGTKKVYKYPGNYVVLKNVKRKPGHYMFSSPSVETTFIIYQFRRTEDYPKGDCYYVSNAKDLADAKEQIKSQDFRPWHERLMQRMQEGDEFKDIYAPQPGDIKEIAVAIKTWWRRGYGGEYHTARVYVNGELVTVRPENGGSDNVALYDAFGWLRDKGYCGDMARNESPRSYCERHGIKLEVSTQEVRRERDLDRPVAEAEEFKDLYHPEALRDNGVFSVVKDADKFFIRVQGDVTPNEVEITEADAKYLAGLSEDSFPMACVMDFGAAVFQGSGEEE